MSRTWQDNAAEFALLDKGEGWPFARLVACSVERGNGQGARQPRNDRYEVGKVSAQEFARQAETSAPRVLRYLEAWNKAAGQGLCTPSAELSPTDAPTVSEPDIAWGRVYDASQAGGRPRDSRPEDAATIVERRGAAAVVNALSPEQRRAVAGELGKTDEGIDAALEGYRNRPEAQTERRQHTEREAARTENTRTVFHHRLKFVFAPVMAIKAYVTEVCNEGDGRDFVRDEKGIEEAKLLADVLTSIASQISAWGEGDTSDPWDRGLLNELLNINQEGE